MLFTAVWLSLSLQVQNLQVQNSLSQAKVNSVI